jgi:LysM repeat protein
MLWVNYVVQKNEWLDLIARRYKVNLKVLIAHNPQIINPDRIWPGEVISVPIDNSIAPGELTPPKDLPPPILGPHVVAPDGAIIRLPQFIRLPFYGQAHITQEDCERASVQLTDRGYYVSFYHDSGPSSEAGDVAKDVGEHAVTEGAVAKGLLPAFGGWVVTILSTLNPSSAEKEFPFVVTADNGKDATINILYPERFLP